MIRRYFTLIELMIVVIIVAILAAAAVPIYQSVVSRGYEAEVVSALSTIRTAQRMHKAENDTYADDLSDLEAEDFIGSADFEDMKYVDYGNLDITEGSETSFTAEWDGEIDGYNYGRVTIDQEGTITRHE